MERKYIVHRLHTLKQLLSRSYLFLFLFILSCISIQDKKHTTNKQLLWLQDIEGNFKIIKIEENKSTYIVYANNGSNTIKLVSMKDKSPPQCQKKIELHEVYYIKARHIFDNLEDGGLFIDSKPIKRFEGDSIKNLYNSSNVLGLCYKKPDSVDLQSVPKE